jgi:hypothetical protein
MTRRSELLAERRAAITEFCAEVIGNHTKRRVTKATRQLPVADMTWLIHGARPALEARGYRLRTLCRTPGNAITNPAATGETTYTFWVEPKPEVD